MTINMVLATKSSQLDQYIRETMSMVGLKELANITGQMDNFIRENGSEDSNTDLECGREPRETAMLVNGEWGKPTAMEFMSGLTVTDMKANLKIA